MRVRKRDGRIEDFSKEKIMRTAVRAGLSADRAKKVAEEVEKRIYDGITTDEVLDIVISEIEKISKKVSTKYGLKSSLLRLGPAGYRFEKFVSALLRAYGYKTRINELIEGKCATHEVDVIAEKDKNYIVECKFHNTPTYTGLKDILYSYARFLDISEIRHDFQCVWVFTNTKFSSEAMRFAECRGIKLTGWHYPENDGIEALLERKRLYPVTVLRLSNFEIEELLKHGFAFCNEIAENKKRIAEIFGKRAQEIVAEAEIIVQ
ncbi:MAG: ATP cone domain-containing protein [Archaeoglobaceae archaeon]